MNIKLISICPSNTELVAYLNLTSSLIAIDDFSDWPNEVQTLPRLGSDLKIDMDKVEALQPNLVLASRSVPGMERNIEELKKRKIPYVVVPNPKTLKEVAACLQFVGEVTNTYEHANHLVEKFHRILENYEMLSKKVETPQSIYWEWWPKPIFTPGANNWLTEMSRLAGGINIFGDIHQASVQTDWDEVKKRNPNVMCIVWVGRKYDEGVKNIILKRPSTQEMDAITHDRLYILEEHLFCRPSPRLLTGLAKIAYLLHPDIYPPFHEEKDVLLQVK